MNGVVFAAALGAVIIFGGSAVATRVAVSAISAIDVSIMRTLIGGLVALPLAFLLRYKVASITLAERTFVTVRFLRFYRVSTVIHLWRQPDIRQPRHHDPRHTAGINRCNCAFLGPTETKTPVVAWLRHRIYRGSASAV